MKRKLELLLCKVVGVMWIGILVLASFGMLMMTIQWILKLLGVI